MTISGTSSTPTTFTAEFVKGYVGLWLEKYPWSYQWMSPQANEACRVSETEFLDRFNRRDLTRGAVVRIIWWKFKKPLYRNRALAGVAPEMWSSAQAHICDAWDTVHVDGEDDWAPMEHLLKIPGWGPAMASVLLAAWDRGRFTIADRRSLASLTALGFIGKKYASFPESKAVWLDYLRICKQLAADAGCTLREVDQALWMASGTRRLPRVWVTDPVELTVGDLTLRTVDVETGDAEALLPIYADPVVSHALNHDTPRTVERLYLGLWCAMHDWENNLVHMFAVLRKGKIIGCVRVGQINTDRARELTIVLEEDSRRHGYGLDIAEEVGRWVLDTWPHVRALQGSCVPDNEASIALMKKAGMTDCGVVTSNEGLAVRKFEMARRSTGPARSQSARQPPSGETPTFEGRTGCRT